MHVTVAGFLMDHKSRVLLQRLDSNTLAPIRRGLEPNEAPEATLARAFREETGLIVLPVRPTGVYESDFGRQMTICYRCTLRGGDLKTPEGSPAAGFFDTYPLPRGLNAADRRLLDDALHHAGGPVRLAQLPATGSRLSRLLGRREAAAPGTEWGAEVMLVLHDGEGQIVCERHPGGIWRPLGDVVYWDEAMWEAAARLQARALPSAEQAAAELRLVQISTAHRSIDFVFVAPPYPQAAFARLASGWDTWPLDRLELDQLDDDDVTRDASLARDALAAAGTVVRLAP